MASSATGRRDPSAGSTVLSVANLTVALPEGGDRELAVSGVSFRITAGETLCLVGESGSGKTVIAEAVMGMLPRKLPVKSGEVHLEGGPLPPQRSVAFNSIRGRRMAMIFQDAVASLDPIQRVGRQLEEILAVHGVAESERRERVLRILEDVRLPDPESIFRAYPHQLSGGQAQRIAIAGALLLDPVLLIADEPTTALDVTTQAEILRLMETLQRERNTSVLFITHDFGVVSEIADSICVMKDGEIVESGNARSVLHDPSHEYTKRLLNAAGDGRAERPIRTGEPVLAAEGLNLVYRFGNFLDRRTKHAVRDVSLTLEKGKTLAVVGESGSGKSSIARCLLRLEEIESGTIRYLGRDITRLQGRRLREMRSRIQVVLQDPYSALNPRQTVLSAIAEGPIIHGLSRRLARERARNLLRLTGLTEQAADRYPHEFSGGQRQRICIARALAVEPEILIADEAVSSLDVSLQAQILDLFQDLQSRLGFALLFITHDLSTAVAISDQVLVLKDGEAVEAGPSQDVFGNPQNTYTRELLSAVPKFSPGEPAAA